MENEINTPPEEKKASNEKTREKKKWQQAFRRYVIDQVANPQYAPYFGLDTKKIRSWFELQFENGLSWENFGTDWQFEHVVPVGYFNFSDEDELKLCWNFINLRVVGLKVEENSNHQIDIIAVRPYFEDLYNKTSSDYCKKMLKKIKAIEVSGQKSQPQLENFISQNKILLENIEGMSNEEFNKLNQGMTLNDILLEKELLRKFG